MIRSQFRLSGKPVLSCLPFRLVGLALVATKRSVLRRRIDERTRFQRSKRYILAPWKILTKAADKDDGSDEAKRAVELLQFLGYRDVPLDELKEPKRKRIDAREEGRRGGEEGRGGGIYRHEECLAALRKEALSLLSEGVAEHGRGAMRP